MLLLSSKDVGCTDTVYHKQHHMEYHSQIFVQEDYLCMSSKDLTNSAVHSVRKVLLKSIV
jgi:hypothetical protein